MSQLADAGEYRDRSWEAKQGLAVTKCICFDAEFATIRRIALSEGSLLAAHKQTGFGARCGLCVPYIQFMMRTAETDLPVMWSSDFEDHGIPAPAIVKLEKFLEQASKTS
ncbi:MAG: hypothetical protein AAFR38_02535 [Planctomycetota bacterium]